MQFKGLKPYLIIQMIMAVPFLYLIIGLDLGDKIGITNMHRVIMSVGIFAMIIAWAGMMEAKKWSNALEIFRLLYMGTVVVYILSYLEVFGLTSYASIVIALFVGVSILFVNFRFKQSQLEGTRFVVPAGMH